MTLPLIHLTVAVCIFFSPCELLAFVVLPPADQTVPGQRPLDPRDTASPIRERLCIDLTIIDAGGTDLLDLPVLVVVLPAFAHTILICVDLRPNSA